MKQEKDTVEIGLSAKEVMQSHLEKLAQRTGITEGDLCHLKSIHPEIFSPEGFECHKCKSIYFNTKNAHDWDIAEGSCSKCDFTWHRKTEDCKVFKW